MRGQTGSVPEISVSGLEILPYEHFIPVIGMNGGTLITFDLFLISETGLKFLP